MLPDDDTAVCDRVGVEWTTEIISKQSWQHVLHVPLSEIPLLVIGGTDPLIFGMKISENNVFVPLVGHWLANVLEVTSPVQDIQEVFGALAGLYLCVLEFLAARLLASLV